MVLSGAAIFIADLFRTKKELEMKKIIILFLLLSITLSGISFAGQGKKYGKELTLKDTTKISEILQNPEGFVGKRVLVNGLVVGVCAKRGCWLDIAGDKPYQKIKVKVEDGEMVFPLTAKGNHAVAEGEVEKFELTKEQVLKLKEYQAKEHGVEFDPSTVTGGATIYQIRGFGAMIKE